MKNLGFLHKKCFLHAVSRSCFSTTNYMEDPEFKKFISEEEYAQNEFLREQMHKFEREWKKLYEDERQKDPTKPLSYLNEYHKKKVEYLVKKVQQLNLLEMKYFAIKVRDQMIKTTAFNPLKLNAHWPEFKNLGSNNYQIPILYNLRYKSMGFHESQ